MQFLSYLINGISLGSVYALIALGYTMVYGIAKMLNFAHGDVIMIGSYVVFFAFGSAGMNPVLAIVLSMVVCTVLGVTIERVAYRPLREAPSLAVLITAIGVSYLLQQVAQLAWSSNPKSFTSVVSGMKPISLFDGQLTISAETVVTIIACVIIMVALIWFVNHTSAGHAMQAVSEDRGAAQLMGVNVNATISLTFAIGSALAAVAGALLCSSYPTLQPTTGRYARYQGLRGRCFRRHRLHPGRVPGRHPAGHHREPEQGLHFHPAVRRNRVPCPGRGAHR